jgi:pimeloyl-ACP methyl ester carboxylesterase
MYKEFHMKLSSASLVFTFTLALAAGASGLALSTPARAAAAETASVSHQNAATQYIDAAGTRLAYRRFGKAGGVPLVFFQHFVGNMDGWDPAVTDGFAREREVILFDNAGVASSGGEVPATVEGMAAHAINLLQALRVKQADLLGFSLGSLVAQHVALERPDLVRRVILVGSGPRAGVGMASLTPEFLDMLKKKHDVADELLLDVFFTPSDSSQQAGRAFLDRLRARQVNRDPDVNDKVAPAQIAAFAAWGAPQAGAQDYLARLRQPVLVVSGSRDLVHYTINSFTLQQQLPNAQLIVYPDSNHGSIYQYPQLFLAQAKLFLNQP